MKLFAVSDVHGHATILKSALQEAGFDPHDPSHLLVCCGDCFDRGPENRAVLQYLQSLPHKVLIRGNHEDLLEQAMRRGAISSAEVYNGTVDTIEEFFGKHAITAQGRFLPDPAVKAELTAFLQQTVDYFETERYVFTHGWVPVLQEWGELKMHRDWRRASLSAWENARYMGWNKIYQNRLTLPDKTVVCGHRSARYGSEFDPERSVHCYDPFFGKHLIAIDALTVVSGKVNVLVLEDDLLPPRTHTMKLQREHFDHIADGSKTIEMRLLDEKRQKIRRGDRIEFVSADEEEEKLVAEVEAVYSYPGFDELVEDFTPAELGFAGVDGPKIVEQMLRMYGVEKAFKHRSLAIRIKRCAP